MNWRLGKQKILMEANLMTQADPRWEELRKTRRELVSLSPVGLAWLAQKRMGNTITVYVEE